MLKLMIVAASALVLSAPLAVAGPGKGNTGNGNSGLAQDMAGSLSGGNATLGRDLGSNGKGTASAVSGGGNGGWGNIGSQSGVLGGGQVSGRDGERGK